MASSLSNPATARPVREVRSAAARSQHKMLVTMHMTPGERRGALRGALLILCIVLSVFVLGVCWILGLLSPGADPGSPVGHLRASDIAASSIASVSETQPESPTDSRPSDSNSAPAIAPRQEVGMNQPAPREPGIYLKVRVVTPHNTSVLDGVLSCLHGAPGMDDPGKFQRLELRIQGDLTLIKLPLTSQEAYLTASSPGLESGQAFLRDLRRFQGRWVKDDGWAERDVVVQMGARDSAVPALSGTVLVDTERRAPNGLCIRAIPSSRLTAIPSNQRSCMAIVDPIAATYRLPVLPSGEWEIEATSLETVTSWTPVAIVPNSEPRILDLQLVRGSKLVLEIRDARTRDVCPGQTMVLRYGTRTASPRDMMMFRETVLRSTSRINGDCEFASLPKGSLVRVFAAGAHEAGEPLLEMSIPSTGPEETRRQVWINGKDPSEVEFFGNISNEDFPGNGSLVLRVRIGNSKTDRSYVVNGDRWNVSCPASTECSLWLEREVRRVTDVVTVWLASGSKGPVILRPLVFPTLQIEWTNAPPDRTLRLASIDPNRGIPRTRDVDLNTRDGYVVWDRYPDGAVSVALKSKNGSTINWTWEASQVSSPLRVDLGGDCMREVEIYINSDRPTRRADLVLVALEANQRAGHCFAVVNLDNGRSSGTVPLFKGPCYYRLNGACSGSIVCGIADSANEHADQLRRFSIRWTGSPCTTTQLGLTEKTGLELLRCEGKSLAIVNQSLRQFRLNDIVCFDPGSVAPAVTSLNCNVAACEFQLFSD